MSEYILRQFVDLPMLVNVMMTLVISTSHRKRYSSTKSLPFKTFVNIMAGSSLEGKSLRAVAAGKNIFGSLEFTKKKCLSLDIG